MLNAKKSKEGRLTVQWHEAFNAQTSRSRQIGTGWSKVLGFKEGASVGLFYILGLLRSKNASMCSQDWAQITFR